MIQTGTLTYNTLKNTVCWQLIYDNDNKIHFYGETGGDTYTIHNLFAGTKAECEAKIAELNLVPIEGGYEEPAKQSILVALEASKEALKWQAVEYIKLHTSATIADFMATLEWQDQALAQTMIYTYATNAQSQGLLALPNTNPETCWSVLVGLVLSSTDEELHGLLD